MPDGLHERVVILETQVARLVSDAESEKRTRANANSTLDSRLRRVEYVFWGLSGCMIGLQVLTLIKPFLK